MNFVNNWIRTIELAAGALSVSGLTGLPDGDYRLTLADSATTPTRWEIVDAALVGGEATLVRAQEGTADQAWPSGSVIYCALTAGTLNSLGGGGTVLVGAAPPAAAPPSVGALFVDTLNGVALIGGGTEDVGDWVLATEGYIQSLVAAGSPASLTVGHFATYITAAIRGDLGITDPDLRLVFPAYRQTIKKLMVDAFVAAGSTMQLRLDFSSLAAAGDVYFVVAPGMSATADGAVAVLELTAPLRASILLQSYGDEFEVRVEPHASVPTVYL